MIDQPSKIGDRSNRIRACDADAGPQSFLTSDASWCYRGPRRRPSGLPQGILHYFSLFFSLNLWVLLICCGVWIVLFWERESFLSFWIDSLPLSLYNYSVYLPPLFFWLYPLVCHCVGQLVLVLVSLSFSVEFIWLAPLVWILSIEWG